MKHHQVLFIQGGGKGTHDDWDNKLVESLEHALGSEYEVRYPRMPHEEQPTYARWKAALRDELAKLGDDAVVVGHSVGGTFVINALADDPPRRALRGVFLVASPFVGNGGMPSEEIRPMSNLGAKLPDQLPVYLYHGTDDTTAPVDHVGLYESAIPQAVVVRRLAGRDHQLDNDLSEVAADIRRLERTQSQ